MRVCVSLTTLVVRNLLGTKLALFVKNVNAHSNFLFGNLAYSHSQLHKDTVQKCSLHDLKHQKLLKRPSTWSSNGTATIWCLEKDDISLVFACCDGSAHC